MPEGYRRARYFMLDGGAMQPSAVNRPPGRDLLYLGIAVAFISTSGPLIAVTAAPALAIAFWRCFLGSVAMAPWVLWRRRKEFADLDRREWKLIIIAGLFLAAHFATWIPSLRFTTVASSTALVATQPIWAALIARMRGAHVPTRAWIGIGLAMVGILALTGVDATIDPRQLIGDGLALLGAIFAAAYVTVGAQVRQSVSTVTMTFILYAVAAGALFVVSVAGGQALSGYSLQAWIYILLLTIGSQLLGHSLINRALATTSATVASLAILFEMPGSTLIAALWIGQIPPLAIVPAVILLFAGLVMVIRSGDRVPPNSTGPPPPQRKPEG
jgi:drug/metabolite transporter (DMT)-like permease